MPAKTIVLEGYGDIILNPINIRDKDYETCDSEGKPLTCKVEGTRAKTVYRTKDGAEIPSSQICRKFVIDEEELIVGKMSPTSKVEKEDIEVLEENTMIYNAIEKKMYHIFTDNKKLKDLILKENKSLRFPLICGLGWKAYDAILTAWKDHIVLVGCRGNINDALDVYQDDVVELEIEAIPQREKAKKLLKAIAV